MFKKNLRYILNNEAYYKIEEFMEEQKLICWRPYTILVATRQGSSKNLLVLTAWTSGEEEEVLFETDWCVSTDRQAENEGLHCFYAT